jgi:hypothetical protein
MFAEVVRWTEHQGRGLWFSETFVLVVTATVTRVYAVISVAVAMAIHHWRGVIWYARAVDARSQVLLPSAFGFRLPPTCRHNITGSASRRSRKFFWSYVLRSSLAHKGWHLIRYTISRKLSLIKVKRDGMYIVHHAVVSHWTRQKRSFVSAETTVSWHDVHHRGLVINYN